MDPDAKLIALNKSEPTTMVGFQQLFGANLSHVETQSMPISMTVARKLRDWILGEDKLATFPTAVLLVFVALWKIEKACTSVLRVLLWPFKRKDPREEVLHFQRATGMGDNLAFAAIDLYIAQKLGYKKRRAMSKASRQLAQPSATRLSGGLGKRQMMPQAALNSGQPLPLGGQAGQPNRHCFRHRMLVDWRDFDSFYLVKEPKRKEARDLFQLLFDVAPGKHKIEVLTTSMIDPAKHKLVVGEQSSAHTLSLARTITLAPALALTLAKTNTPIWNEP